MRFSIANLLLLGTALAAPLHEVDRADKSSQETDIIKRGLVPVLPRAPAFIAPKPIVVPKPKPIVEGPSGPGAVPDPAPRPIVPGDAPAAPGAPEQPPPRLGEEPPAAKPDDPAAPGAKPDDPNAAPKPDGEGTPRLGTEPAPKPKPEPVPKACRLKRGLDCDPLPGADENLAIDKKYTRTQDKADPADIPTGPFTKPDAPKGQWWTTIIDNSPESKAAFSSPEFKATYTAKLKEKGWNDADIDWWIKKQEADFASPANGMSKTHENPQTGQIIIEDSRNAEWDLAREYTGPAKLYSGRNAKTLEYTRPALPNSTPVGQRKMIGDNFVTASRQEGMTGPPKPTSMVRYNVVTPESMAVFKANMPAGKTEFTTKPGDKAFDDITKSTVHGAQPNKMLAEDPRYAGTDVKSYTVYLKKEGRGTRATEKWYMDIEMGDKA
jgi:hypothetical protein